MIHGRWENLQILVVMPAAVLDRDDVVNVVLDAGLLRERVCCVSHFLLNQKIVVWMEQISFERSTA